MKDNKNRKLEKMFLFCISYKMKEIRVRSKKTQEEVAQFLGVSKKDWVSFEKNLGRFRLKGFQIAKLLVFLGANLEDHDFFQTLNVRNVKEYYKKLKREYEKKLKKNNSSRESAGKK